MAKRQRSGPTFIQRSRAVPSQEKAIYHNILGAGRRGVLRPFLDANDEDQVVIMEALDKLIQTKLDKL